MALPYINSPFSNLFQEQQHQLSKAHTVQCTHTYIHITCALLQDLQGLADLERQPIARVASPVVDGCNREETSKKDCNYLETKFVFARGALSYVAARE